MKNNLVGLLLKLKKEERGSTIVLVAIGMVVFLAFTALVADVGLLYLNRARLANAIDAATLAGVQELPRNPVQARLLASDYAARNGADPDQLNITISSDNQSIRVESAKTVNLFFAKAIGISTGEVAVGAEAKVGPITSAMGIAPLSVVEQQFQSDKLYFLKDGAGNNYQKSNTYEDNDLDGILNNQDDDDDNDGIRDDLDDDDDNDGIMDRDDSGHGWFGPLSLGGNGESRYRDNLQTGYQNELKIGMVVDTETGNMSGGTRYGIEYRINRCPHTPRCTVDTYHRDCPMVMYIPVIRAPSGPGQVSQVEIVGFAAFLVAEVPGTGANSVIKGYFINTVMPGEIDFTQTSYGLSGVKLIH
ncbi:MAG: Tad domain-containing protein [Clostridia bacterium]|nr:Tad domain-containing protein [Clostridia bacterium]